MRLSVELDDAAEIHHRDAVADVPHHGEVVADEEIGEPVLLLQVDQQVQHLRLHRDVERRDRLVGDDHVGIDRQRLGDAEPLALAAGELVRVLAHRLGPQADALRTAARRARRVSLPRAMPKFSSGSPTIAPADRRGLSEE